jgi:hypothetical protein
MLACKYDIVGFFSDFLLPLPLPLPFWPNLAFVTSVIAKGSQSALPFLW